jgi:hypothetical protein
MRPPALSDKRAHIFQQHFNKGINKIIFGIRKKQIFLMIFFDFDFNILTAFIRLGRAGPVGAGCPPYYFY